jgi:hypothetical protein
MIDSVTMTDRVAVPFLTKLNPLWWLVGPDGWTVPTINNGEPYLPEVTNQALRIFYWFFCRNPLMNFVGFIMGAEDKNYTVYGSAPVLATTLRDVSPPMTGWKWSVIVSGISLPAFLVFAIAALGAWFLPAFGKFPWLLVGAWPLTLIAAFALFKGIGIMPFVAFWNGTVEFYLGWRPASGGFGLKFVVPG